MADVKYYAFSGVVSSVGLLYFLYVSPETLEMTDAMHWCFSRVDSTVMPSVGLLCFPFVSPETLEKVRSHALALFSCAFSCHAFG